MTFFQIERKLAHISAKYIRNMTFLATNLIKRKFLHINKMPLKSVNLRSNYREFDMFFIHLINYHFSSCPI